MPVKCISATARPSTTDAARMTQVAPGRKASHKAAVAAAMPTATLSATSGGE